MSLMEILVVIAIIVLLTGIILPVYMRAKNKAQDVVEINRLKQVYVSYSLYLEDNDGKRPDFFASIRNQSNDSLFVSPNDITEQGLANGFRILDEDRFRDPGKRQSVLGSFELLTWVTVDLWPENKSKGLAISPIKMKNEPSEFGPMTSIVRFARVNLDGSIVTRNFLPVDGVYMSDFLFLDEKYHHQVP